MASKWKYEKRHITDTYLRNIKSPINVLTMDTDVAGFHIRYSATTHKIVFYLYYKMRLSKKQHNLRLGRYGEVLLKDARSAANDYRRLISDGHSPMEEKKLRFKQTEEQIAKNKNVSELLEEYMEKYSCIYKKLNSQKSDRNIIKNYINPYIGKIVISDLNLRVLTEFYNAVAKEKSFASANHAMTLVSHFWNWCEKYEYLKLNTNPCRHIRKGKNKPTEKTILDADGYKRFMASTEAGLTGKTPYHPRCFRVMRIMALTGCRPSEITELKKTELKLDSEYLDLHDSKTGPRKVPLSNAAISELRKAMLESEKNTNLLFPATRIGINKGIDIRKAFAWALNDAGLPHMRRHDLRHSFVSLGTEMGENALAISKVVGHSRVSTTEIYMHATDNSKLKTANNIANAICG